ncbi:MAG TPA: hypothetical protein VFO94_01970, partial [Gammaproteobacteria bacterium]|nr:hypothetical protein [Gammaproteobacteria bacterium]
MQLTRDSVPANLIRAWEPGRIRIADRWIAGHVLVMPERIIEGWGVASPAELVLDDLREALASQ